MKKKTISAIAAVAVAGAFTVGLGAVSSWFTNWNTNTWFGRGGSTQTVRPDTSDDEDKLNVNGMITEVHNSDEISLRMVSYASENAIASGTADGVRITATVKPEDASDKSVNYSIAWKNPASSWAKNKSVSDYVSMTVSGASATIVGKQPFGEQIIVTCTSAFDEHIAATCTVDYAKRLSFIEFHCYSDDFGDIEKNGGYIDNDTTGKADTRLSFGSTYDLVGISPFFGDGTVSDNMTYTVTFTASDTYVSLQCGGKVPGSYTLTGELNELTFDETFLRAVYGSSYTSKSAFYSICRSGQMDANGVLKATFTASGNYSSLSGSINLNFVLNTLGTAVSGVELDPGNIVL